MLLVLWSILISGTGLSSLEFLRHTEADRTLISWELIESDSFLVPTLLHSEILTKPPLYYWLSAVTISIFGEPSELVARLVSFLSSIVFVLFQYYFWYSVSGKRTISALAGFSLGSSLLFFILSTVAEIDMLFGCLTGVALGALYFVIEGHEKQVRFGILLSVATALAFLTKGPPVLFFLVGGGGLYLLWKVIFFRAEFTKTEIKRLLVVVLFVLAAILIMILLWLIPLGIQVGWGELGSRLKEEVFLRVVNYSDRGRGISFYLLAFFVNGLPWTFFLLIGLLRFYAGRPKEDESWHSRISPLLEDLQIRRFFQYSLCVLAAGFLMLSLAQGKSSRYAFPLMPFLMNITLFFSASCLKPVVFKKLVSGLKPLSILVLLVSLFLLVFISIEGVSAQNFYVSILPVSLFSVFFLFSKPRLIWRNWFSYLIIVIIIAKINYTLVYIPHRNYTKGVRDLSASVVRVLDGSPIYTIELFERWTVYYAKRLGVDAYRLSPALVKDMLSGGGEKGEELITILLDLDQEAWRFDQIRLYDSGAKVLAVFPHSTSSNYLVQTKKRVLPKLGLFSHFPTTPGLPYYPELSERGLL